VPTTAAASWHCKYGVTSSTKIPDGTAEASRGYIYLIAESYGFDNNVIVIVQPRGKYLDFNFRSQTTDPERMTKVFKSYFGRKYLIPAEYDVYLDFAPISYKLSGQESLSAGKFQFLAKWVADTTDYENDETVEIVRRLPSANSGTNPDVVPVTDPDSDDGAVEFQDNTVLPTVEERTSAIDNEIDSKWKSWKDKEAFNIAGVSVSNEEAAVGSTAILIIIIGIVCICCFVSYLERKKIAEEARRASAYAKRASQKIRRSIRSMRGQPPEPEEPEAPRTDKDIKNIVANTDGTKN
jgi:hypothetical protein